jgi:bifunctional non-homologous end joining protein LigD
MDGNSGSREVSPAISREMTVPKSKQAETDAAPGGTIKLTHPDRLYWPEDGVTKQQLADHYAMVWPRIAPHVVGRPLALLRCPDGVTHACFFQKHAWRGINAAIRQVPDPGDNAAEPFLVIDDLDGLTALAQAGALEIHPWGAPLRTLETPDQMIFDLDPGAGVGWDGMVAAARDVKARLEAAGLPAFVKTSGGKGLHVVAPLAPKAGWDEVKDFAHALAESMAADAPDRIVAQAAKAKRDDHIFVDYLRNARGATAVAPYSTRARPGAAVATPVSWDELDGLGQANVFTVANMGKRLRAADPWADFRKAAAPLR